MTEHATQVAGPDDAMLTRRHDVRCSNKDYDFFYNGLEDQRLLVQKCSDCAALRNPPTPMCPKCQSLSWCEQEITGTGRLYSYIIHYYPVLERFPSPHVVALAEFEGDIRFVASLAGLDGEEIAIGIELRPEFFRGNGIASFRFVPAV